MSDVSCVCCTPVVEEVRKRGLAPEPLVEGLSIGLPDVEDPRHRIPWDDFTVFAQRATDLLGGVHEYEELARRSACAAVPGVVRQLLPTLRSVAPIYRASVRWWGPRVFRATQARCEVLPDGRLREIVEILPDYAECPEFFPGCRGVIRAMPQLLGQPEPKVELQHDGRIGEYLIEPPEPKPRRRIFFGGRAPAPVPKPPPVDERARLAALFSRLGRELAWRNGANELATALVRFLEEEFPVRGIRLSRSGTDQNGGIVLAESGDRSGPPYESFALRVATRTVGRLSLWGFEDDTQHRDADALHELLPWMGVALENARARDEVQRLTDLLEDDVRDWRRVERSLQQLLGTNPHKPFGVRPGGEPVLLEGAETILLVDEDESTRRASRWFLEARGYTVVEARNASHVAALLETRTTPIDLLVTDVDHPAFSHELARRAMTLHPALRGTLLLRLRNR